MSRLLKETEAFMLGWRTEEEKRRAAEILKQVEGLEISTARQMLDACSKALSACCVRDD